MLNVRFCCFSLSFMTVNEDFGGIFDGWLDKRSDVKTSVWALKETVKSIFHISFDSLSTYHHESSN